MGSWLLGSVARARWLGLGGSGPEQRAEELLTHLLSILDSPGQMTSAAGSARLPPAPLPSLSGPFILNSIHFFLSLPVSNQPSKHVPSTGLRLGCPQTRRLLSPSSPDTRPVPGRPPAAPATCSWHHRPAGDSEDERGPHRPLRPHLCCGVISLEL